MVVNNPNNWHWVDKNCVPWAKQYFVEKFEELTVDNDLYKITITGSTVNGDCDVSNRKGKVVCIYDLNISFTVQGQDRKKDTEFSGSISLPEFMHDETDFDYQFNTFGEYTKDVKQHLVPVINRELLMFQQALIDAHTRDLQE